MNSPGRLSYESDWLPPNPKAESTRPRSQGLLSASLRDCSEDPCSNTSLCDGGFGIRASDFLRYSSFGFRISAVVNICAPFIRRPVGTSLLSIGLFLAGVMAYHFMPVAAIPRVDFPMIHVSASLPGADPATIASSLAAPLERRLGQIAGVTEMTSVSTLGGCAVSIQFDLNRNVDGAARDVQAAINAAAGDLPINLPSPPTYHKVNPAALSRAFSKMEFRGRRAGRG